MGLTTPGWASTQARHSERRIRQTKALLRELLGEQGVRRRAREIARLPRVVWKGRELLTITCHGTTGKGPHLVNVPEALVWALIDLRAFRRPFHA